MYKIYKIVDNTNNNTYYGQTKLTLKQRMNTHRSDFKKGTCSSRLILVNDNYYTEIIEDNLNEEEANIRERYYLQNYPCVNKMKYDFNAKEYSHKYYKENKDKCKEYYKENKDKILKNNKDKCKEYYKENKDKLKETERERYFFNKYSNVIYEFLQEIQKF